MHSADLLTEERNVVVVAERMTRRGGRSIRRRRCWRKKEELKTVSIELSSVGVADLRSKLTVGLRNTPLDGNQCQRINIMDLAVTKQQWEEMKLAPENIQMMLEDRCRAVKKGLIFFRNCITKNSLEIDEVYDDDLKVAKFSVRLNIYLNIAFRKILQAVLCDYLGLKHINKLELTPKLVYISTREKTATDSETLLSSIEELNSLVGEYISETSEPPSWCCMTFHCGDECFSITHT